MLKRYVIRADERGLRFVNGELREVLQPGVYWRWGLRQTVDVLNIDGLFMVHDRLRHVVDSGLLQDEIEAIDLAENERALVWQDGRLVAALRPGLFALWKVQRPMIVERFDASNVRFEHGRLDLIANKAIAQGILQITDVPAQHEAVLEVAGRVTEVLGSGRYAFWKASAPVRLRSVDLREQVVDLTGQDIMTADRVTLRLNAMVAYKVKDARVALTAVEDVNRAVYREAQLVLREVVGATELEAFLVDKDPVVQTMTSTLVARTERFGVQISAFGVKDLILPGEMRELLNRVTEAKAAAEASLITRREETAAMRSQANTAKILENNPTLMRLRELEVIEKVIERANLQVVLGESGLGDRLMKML